MKLTFDAIKKAKPGDVLKDATIAGLQLRATKTGKSFLYYYRTKTGIERRPKIGNFPAISLESARAVAAGWAIEVTLGRDPSEDRKRASDAPRVSELWSRFKEQKSGRRKSLPQYERLWLTYLAPKFGDLPAGAVTYEMISDFHQAMEATPIQANRCLALLSAMFSFAWRPLRWVSENPCRGVHRFPERRRRRYMTATEAARIASILEVEALDHPLPVAFLYLLIFTGARKSEIAGAQWGQLHGNKLVLTEHKTDGSGEDRVIFLPPQAMAVIEQLPRTNGAIVGIQSPKRVWERVRRAAGCPDLRMHDLRHSFASAGIKAGLTLKQVGDLLGHGDVQTTQGYAHLMDDVGHVAAAAAADVLEQMMTRQKG